MSYNLSKLDKQVIHRAVREEIALHPFDSTNVAFNRVAWYFYGYLTLEGYCISSQTRVRNIIEVEFLRCYLRIVKKGKNRTLARNFLPYAVKWQAI